ncbi:MAG: peptide chain release factor 1 [Mycoplasmataceae bacterium]|nr:peptide chain release factor 1 [Mycoplasmataceae bacterium]
MIYNKNLFASLQKIKETYIDLENQKNSETTTTEQFISINKQTKKFEAIVIEFDKYNNLIKNAEQAEEIVFNSKDEEFKELAKLDLAEAHEQIPILEEKLKIMLIPSDPNNDKNIFIEMRPAAGGDESTIFVEDLFNCYKAYCESKHWRITVMDASSNGMGLDYIFFSVKGEEVYSKMKFESGVHRVQRVPETETKGRVHTSTITVAVMPEQEEIKDINFSPSEIRVDTYRAGGKGGQHVNKSESAVRITHLATGLVAECSNERSQIQNREVAMNLLKTKVLDKLQRDKKESEDGLRRSQVGTGERSEKIRTYNYPQNRVTDHRVNLTLNKLDQIMNGDLNEIIETLITDEQQKLLAEVKI